MRQVTPTQVTDVLLKSCPSFKDKWKQYVKETKGDERLLYIEACEFAHHIVTLYKAKNFSEFQDIFSSIEELYQIGSTETQELLTIGYLEGVQNILGWEDGTEDKEFTNFMGPKARDEWNKLNNFWNKKS